jgi:hypothetical protein
VGEARECRRCLVGEARGCVFRVSNRDFLEILHTPEIAILADRPKLDACDSERLGADLGIPAIEATKVEIWRTVRQFPRLDRIQVIDKKQEHIAIGGVVFFVTSTRGL